MYQILGTLDGNTEVLDTAETAKEASELVYEYRMAFGPNWAVTYTKTSMSFFE